MKSPCVIVHSVWHDLLMKKSVQPLMSPYIASKQIQYWFVYISGCRWTEQPHTLKCLKEKFRFLFLRNHSYPDGCSICPILHLSPAALGLRTELSNAAYHSVHSLLCHPKSGAGPSIWVDSDHVVVIFSQPESALWCRSSAGSNNSICTPVIHRRLSAKRALAIL